MGRKKTERFPERGKRLQTLLTESGMTQKDTFQKNTFPTLFQASETCRMRWRVL